MKIQEAGKFPTVLRPFILVIAGYEPVGLYVDHKIMGFKKCDLSNHVITVTTIINHNSIHYTFHKWGYKYA